METKQCTSCGTVKDIEDFHWHYKSRGIRRHSCNTCRSNVEKERQRQDNYKVKRKDYTLKKTYNISADEYYEKLKYQNYGCGLCGKKQESKQLAVDHCHATGKIRELLCGPCNTGLGQFQDNPELLIKAAGYLRKHSDNT